jgi:hypothetical protein
MGFELPNRVGNPTCFDQLADLFTDLRADHGDIRTGIQQQLDFTQRHLSAADDQAWTAVEEKVYWKTVAAVIDHFVRHSVSLE